MNWQDHLREFEKMRDSTCAPQHQPRSSSASQRNQHSVGQNCSEGHYVKGGGVKKMALHTRTHKTQEATQVLPSSKKGVPVSSVMAPKKVNEPEKVVPKKRLVLGKRVPISEHSRSALPEEKKSLSKSDSRSSSLSQYLDKDFKARHLPKISGEDYSKFKEDLKAKNTQISKDRFEKEPKINMSTTIGMNKPVRKKLKDFIKSDHIQKRLKNYNEETNFDIPHHDKDAKAVAYSTDRTGNQYEHENKEGKRGFKSISLKSLAVNKKLADVKPGEKAVAPTYTDKKGKQYRIPNHLAKTIPDAWKATKMEPKAQPTTETKPQGKTTGK